MNSFRFTIIEEIPHHHDNNNNNNNHHNLHHHWHYYHQFHNHHIAILDSLKHRNRNIIHTILNYCYSSCIKNNYNNNNNNSLCPIVFRDHGISSALYNLIHDCDETYNYWEISHYLIYKTGYVTWEYSPQYALRSYFYLWTYMWPSFILSFLISNEILLFYFTRIAIACLGIFSELYFCIGISKCAGTSVGRYCMAFMLMSSGMYFASTSFLPNTLSMHLTMITFAAWFLDHYKLTIFAAGISILVGWPYAAVVYIPIALSMLLSRRKQLYFILFALVYGAMILVPLILVDSYYYGKLVVAPLNAVLYNVFNAHGGPELYGVESSTYYLINLLLNFNLVLFGAFASLPMLILSKIFMTARKHKSLESSHLMCIVSFILWLIVFSLQSHKEERFMYPVYPLICASCAHTIKLIEQFVVGAKQPYSSPVFKLIVFTCCLAFFGLSLSRVLSVRLGFRSTFEVYSDLKKFDRDTNMVPILGSLNSTITNEQHATSVDRYINVCYGKEWYRYPSSFFLPDSKRYRARFIESNFRGQLPKLYEGLSGPEGLKTRIIYKDFNDLNREERSRYIKPEQCHYLIDSSQSQTTNLEPDYSKDAKHWTILSSHKMLDLVNSPIIIRSFYLPFVSSEKNSYIKYQLLRNAKLFVNTTSGSSSSTTQRETLTTE